MKEFVANSLAAPVVEIAKGEIGVFANKQLKGYLKQFIIDLLTPLAIAKSEEVAAVDLCCDKIDETFDKLNTSLAQSVDAANKTTNAMQQDITSLLNYREAAEADITALDEENANLWAIIKSRFDDVEKGECKKVKKPPVHQSRTAEQKALRSDLPASSSAPVQT